MHTARKLILLIAMALAAVAVMAPSASATEPIEVIEEPTQAHCPNVVGSSGGCTLHAVGEATLRTHFFGIEAQEARCHKEFLILIDGDGGFVVIAIEVTNGSHGETNCPTVSPPCTGSLPWPGTTEETSVNTVELHADVCLDPSEFATCSGEFDVVSTDEGAPGTSESQHTSIVDNRVGSSFCEADMTGESESGIQGNDRIHFRHL